MKFAYKIKTKTGELKEGSLESPDRFALARQFRGEGSTPLSITEAKDSRGFGAINNAVTNFFSRIRLHEKIIFTRNMSGMITAGLSLYRALEVLEKQTRNQKFAKVLHSLIETIDAGGTFSDGMEKFPKVFSTLFVSMIRAGEESGSLAKSLTEVGVNLNKSYTLNKKIKGALMYPGIILSAIVLIGILMFIFVVPTLTKTFKELNVKLPPTTRFVVGLSDFISGHTILFLGSVFAIIALFYSLTRMKRLQPTFDFIVLRLPVLGTMVREVNTARTARTLSSLLSSGVTMTRSIQIAGEVLQNSYYKTVLVEANDAVQKGVPLSTVFKNHTNLYPVMVGEMIEVGEESGRLGDMLLDVANFYEDEVDAKTKDLSTIIEPVLMIFIGAAVGFFAISMLTPMYSLVDAIK